MEKENNNQGLINGFIGVILFSGSLPATRIAVLELNPLFITFSRASLAGILALVSLLVSKQKRPEPKHLLSLMTVAIGVVIGYPLFSAFALQHITSAHSIVFIGILPIATTLFGIWGGDKMPKPLFWLYSLIGSVLVIGYAVSQGINSSAKGNLLMFTAVVLCGLGYAKGGKLTKILGGWQVISWSLLLSLPFMLPLAILYFPQNLHGISAAAWISLSYVSVFSMFIGFVFWYKGLAQGGIAKIGQLQLFQPFFGLGLASFFLQEAVTWEMFAVTVGVILCVIGTKKYA